MDRRTPVISLTPLIDVVFILLVFFMLASSFLDWRRVDLRLAAAQPAAETLVAAVVEVGAAADLILAGRRLSDGELAAAVAARRAAGRPEPFVIRVAPGVPLQRAVDVLAIVRDAGAADVSLSRAEGGTP